MEMGHSSRKNMVNLGHHKLFVAEGWAVSARVEAGGAARDQARKAICSSIYRLPSRSLWLW